VIINNFDFLSTTRLPPETDPELVVDPDAELPRAAAFQGFQAIARRNPQVLELRGSIQHRQLSHGGRFDVHEPFDALPSEQIARVMTLER
jgi:hypothetical protein